MPILDVIDYHKAYGDFVAVDSLSFGVEGGQIVGLLGPNGAGKTTTMRAIAGIIPPTRGQLKVDGFEITADPVGAKKRLAYVPDDPRLFETLTVWEHLQFIATAYEVPDLDVYGQVLLEKFELTEKRDTLAQELSRGMRQKVAICCAYLHRPRLLLLDEPLTGLDPRGIRTMKQSLVEQAALGNAVVISSHLLSLVEGLCTHLLIVNRGKKLFLGSPEEARTAFSNVGDDSLEEVFFRATEAGEVSR
ncbi:ABC transporter ATP-binding protein [Humisphaera borealis]|uniref:ABC transporter ATP-binding protein n=1 Tax=Humisphaera borealis TaxID=2807512 RepID=UPI0019D2E404|nr:ABC transporter ATP-binding protein [Humisphaera borealis]